MGPASWYPGRPSEAVPAPVQRRVHPAAPEPGARRSVMPYSQLCGCKICKTTEIDE